MGILTWIVLGFVAGLIARFVMPGSDSMGLVLTSVLGVVGAVVGGFIATALGYGSVTAFNLPSIGIAAGGALVVLAVYRFAKKA